MMKIRKEDRWAWWVLFITLLMAVCKFAGWLPCSWWVVTFLIWFPLLVLAVCGFALVLAIAITLIFSKGETEDGDEDDEET